jgi:hypothetical protein
MQKVCYKDKEKIDNVVDCLIEKGLNIFNVVDVYNLTVIEEGNFRLKAIEIYNEFSETDNNFIHESNLLSKIQGIKRAIYVLVDADSQIPDHMDDDDQSYRILTGVITSIHTKINMLNSTVDLTCKKTIGFDATSITHNATNFTNFPCTMLIVCLSDNPFKNSELIEIYN